MWVDCKKICLKSSLLLFLLCATNCGKERIQRNPYLSSVNFQIEINTNLPQYDGLRFAGGALPPSGGLSVMFALMAVSIWRGKPVAPTISPKAAPA